MESVNKCRKCRKILPVGAIYCCWCGIVQDESKAPQRGKKRKRAAGSGTIKKLPGNRARPYQACLPLDMGGKPLGTFSTYAEADKALALEVATRPASSRADWTVKDFYDAYITGAHFSSLSKNQQATQKGAWAYCVDIADIKMRDAKKSQWQLCINTAIEMGRSRSLCEKIRQVCSALCKEAMGDGVILLNYAPLLDLGGKETKQLDILSDDEIKVLKAHDGDRRVKFILMLTYTGVRINELLQLQIEDIHDGYFVGGSKTKAGINRIVPILPDVAPYFEYFKNGRTSGDLIIDSKGCKVTIKTARLKWFYETLTELGINIYQEDGKTHRITPHYLRHTFSTRATAAGVDHDVIRQVVGHTTFELTENRYVDKTNKDYMDSKAAALKKDLLKMSCLKRYKKRDQLHISYKHPKNRIFKRIK